MHKTFDKAKARFVVFCLEAYRNQARLSGDKAVDLFLEHGVVEYLEDGYDILHSLGEAALVEDIRQYLQQRRNQPPPSQNRHLELR